MTRQRRPIIHCSLVGLVVVAWFAPVAACAEPTRPVSAGPCDAWRKTIKFAATPQDRRTASLRLAECLITHASAAGLTAELRNDHSYREALESTLDEALNILDSDVVLKLENDAGTTDREAALRRRIDLLRAFAKTFRAIAAAADSDASKEALMSACVELAIYADDPDERVVAAARLWQAAAYRRAGRADRTLQMMRPALGASCGSTADVYGRIERCYALADAGRHVAAIALLTKIEGRIDEWMIQSTQKVRLDARHTVQMTRAEFYRRWSAVLAEQGLTERAAEALDNAKAIEAAAKNDTHEYLELDTTIAPLAPLDDGVPVDDPAQG